MRMRVRLLVLAGLLHSACVALRAEDHVSGGSASSNPEYTVAAFYWPAYHDEPRWRTFFRGTEGEWEIIRNSKPKYEGHWQPRVPLWGYEDESDPKVMAKKIDAAASCGVNAFIFDWYWYDGKPFLEDCINDGFLGAPNNGKIRFYLMWANHDATTLWDIERSHKHEVIWPGAVDRATFDVVADRVIAKYFKHPSYYRIDGKPVFSIYEIGTLIKGLGGTEKTRAALDDFERKVKAAGFPGLHLQGILWGQFPKTLGETVPGDRQSTQENTVRALGIDSLTNYQFVHLSAPIDDYMAWAEKAMALWPRWDKEFSVPYFPHVSVHWDNNPRFKTYTHCVKDNATPENFEKLLRKAKAYADAHPNQPKLITINAWNEWSEGSYLEPDTRYKMAYLEAVRRVFGPGKR
ncbi:MAG: glycoside hydrolase family 99-like domain-containing protein [Phycisphaerae bacterium]|nr:glycoside hydrolase family 99-like domain-containing protein [Phycisphaerae bacterium]